MSLTELDHLANDAFGGPPVPEQDTAEPRYPFVILPDVSGSTAFMPADGGECRTSSNMNAALNLLFQKLKYPAPAIRWRSPITRSTWRSLHLRDRCRPRRRSGRQRPICRVPRRC